jgi:hypothetical protein
MRQADLDGLHQAIEQHCRQQSEAEKPKAPVMSEVERQEAIRFLQSPNLLDAVAEDMEALGYVGEEGNKKLGYLIAISRKLEEPLSGVILSQSGSGKSFLAEVLEKLTPPEEMKMFSRITPAALFYMEADELVHKFVIVEERSGSAEADYSIRALQSSKRLGVLATWLIRL